MQKELFVEQLKDRTKKLAIEIIRLYGKQRKTDEIRIMGKQLIRSVTSVAANYRAACRARSRAEFFAKMSIVVEEADETLFWLELFEESRLVPSVEIYQLKQESIEILSIMAKARKNIK